MKVWELEYREDKTDLERLVEQFTAGRDVDFDARLLDFDIYGSIAHVSALEEVELLAPNEAAKLRNQLRSLLDEKLEIAPEDEDVHTRVENEVTSELGKLGEKLHTARSRNDQVLVDLRLFTKSRLFQVAEELLDLVGSLLEFAGSGSEIPMVGYTHYREAMPSSVGLWAASYAEALLDDLLPLDAAYELLNRSPLGVGAGYGVPVSLNRKLTADLLGFDGVQNNAIYVMNSRGKFEFNLLSALGGVQLDLSRMAEDLIVFSDEKFNFFEIPEPFTTGSSIMPQKENPDVLELVRGRAAAFSGHLSNLFSLLHGLRSGYSRDLQESKKALVEGLDRSESSLAVLPPLIDGLEVNESELLAAFTEEVLATDRVFDRVQAGQTFRAAYREVKELLESAEGAGNIDADRAKEAIDRRKHRGGPGDLQLVSAEDKLEEERKRWKERKELFRDALAELKEPEEIDSGGDSG